MGGKCPLELLQQTCASIGRESPPTGENGGNVSSAKKRKIETKTEKPSEGERPGAKQSKSVKEDINQNKYVVKTENDSDSPITVAKLAKMSPERASPRKTPPNIVQTQKCTQRPKVSLSSSGQGKKSSPTVTATSSAATIPTGLTNMSSLMLNPSSLLHNAEIDRNLRAYASFYSASAASALQAHPLASAAATYPNSSFIPGLTLPTFPYMPYFSGYPTQANTSALSGLFPSLQSAEPMAAQMAQLAAMSQQQQQAAEQAAAAYALSAQESALLQQAKSQAAATSQETERVCNWANCGKKFASADKLSEHVKEHINTTQAGGSTTSAPADSTTGSTPNTSSQPDTPKVATTVSATSLSAPRFNPYGPLSSYPRDLLNSRFVYS